MISDIEKLARAYDPSWDHRPSMFDLRPAFKPTGDLRRDILTLIRTKREDNLKAIGNRLGVSDYIVSKYVQGFVIDGTMTQEQVYQYLPKIKEAHERRERYYQRKQERATALPRATTRTATTILEGTHETILSRVSTK